MSDARGLGAAQIRPAEHLVYGLDGPGVLVSGRVCALLNKLLSLDKIRREVRGQDAQLDQTLLAIRLAGVASESSSPGTHLAPQTEHGARLQPQLTDTISTTAAAAALGITDRGVRKAICEKRLTATKIDGRYRITRRDLAAYRPTRAA